MGTVFSALEKRVGGSPLSKLLHELAPFVLQENPISESILTGQTWRQLAEAREARLKKRTEELIHSCLNGRIEYAPATRVRKNLFKPGGDLGKWLHKCLDGEGGHLEQALREVGDPSRYDAIIDKNQKRKAVTHIQAGARQRLHRDIEAGAELLRDWQKFFTDASSGDQGSYQEKTLFNECRELETAWMKEQPGGSFLVKQLERIKKGESGDSQIPLLRQLSLWPLRLACSTPCESSMFSDGNLVSALTGGDDADEKKISTSVALHAIKGELEPVKEFIRYFNCIDELDEADIGLHAPALRDVIPFSFKEIPEAANKAWTVQIEEEIEDCCNYINDCYFRGAIHSEQQSQANLLLADIERELNVFADTKRKQEDRDRDERGVDFPELRRKLRELNNKLRNWEAAMPVQVKERIEQLREQASGLKGTAREEALGYLDDVQMEMEQERVYSVAWDNIARFENFLSKGYSGTLARKVKSEDKHNVAADFL